MKNTTRLSWLVLTLLLTTSIQTSYAISSIQDTDGDGIPDLTEDANGNGIMDTGETDPYNADTDSGGESDGAEKAAQRNPLDPLDDMTADRDGDGLSNWLEEEMRTDPKKADTDGDGINDKNDPFPLDPRYFTDTNSNQLPDEWERQNGLTDNQVTTTRSDDPDNDGLTNAEELAKGTNPTSADTDRDGVDDKTEIANGTDPKENACLAYAPATSVFPDVIGHWSEDRVQKLRGVSVLASHDSIIRGYGDGPDALFRPDQPVTRYEFLKMVMLSTCTKLWNSTLPNQPIFSDIRSSSVINENTDTALKRRIIYSAVRYGIIEGYDDGTFRANDSINRAEAVKILNRATHLTSIDSTNTPSSFSDIMPSDWFAPYVEVASALGIVKGYDDGTFGPSRLITRAESAKIIYETLVRNPVINGYVLEQ